MNYNLNLQSDNSNFQNINHHNLINQNTFISNCKVNPNFNSKNIMNFSPNHSNTGNLNFEPNNMYNFKPNSNMNLENFLNMRRNIPNMINYNRQKNNQNFGRFYNNHNVNHKYSSNSIMNLYQTDYIPKRLNKSGNILINNSNPNSNIWGFPNQFPYHNNISPNNSMGKNSFSDNELNENHFYNSNNSKNYYKSFSSNFSNSSSDILNESLNYEKDYEMILDKPEDDSVDINDIENTSNLKYTPSGGEEKFFDENDDCYKYKIENTNNFFKENTKEDGNNLNNLEKIDILNENFIKEENLNKENLLTFLKSQRLNYLYCLINDKKITLKDLVKLSDKKIIELIEEGNKHKAALLIRVLMKLDEKLEGDDVMESLNNLDFK